MAEAALTALPVREALTLRDSRVAVVAPGVYAFQSGNCVAFESFRKEAKSSGPRIVSFASGERLDAWAACAARKIIACAVHSASGSRVDVFSYPSLEKAGELAVQAKPAILNRLVFSLSGYGLLAGSAYPENRVAYWRVGRPPAMGEADEGVSPCVVVREIALDPSDGIRALRINPNDMFEFAVVTERAVTVYRLRTQHGKTALDTDTLYRPGSSRGVRDLPRRANTVSWGADGALYFGLDSGKIIALSPTERKVPDAANAANGQRQRFANRPATMNGIVNMLRFEMMEPATGLYSDSDLRGQALSTASRPAGRGTLGFVVPRGSGPGSAVCGMAAVPASAGGYLFASTADRRVLVVECGSKGAFGVAKKGALLTRAADPIVCIAVDAATDSVLCLSEDGSLSRFSLAAAARLCGGGEGSLEDGDSAIKLDTVGYKVPVSTVPRDPQWFLPEADRTRGTAKGVVSATVAVAAVSKSRCAVISSDGQIKLVSYGDRSPARLIASYRLKSPLVVAPSAEDRVAALLGAERDRSRVAACVSTSPDGEFFAVGCVNGVVTVFRARDGLRPVFSARLHAAPAAVVELSGGGRRLTSVGADQSVVAVDLSSKRPIATWASIEDKVPAAQRRAPLSACWFGNRVLVVALEMGVAAMLTTGSDAVVQADIGCEALELLAVDDVSCVAVTAGGQVRALQISSGTLRLSEAPIAELDSAAGCATLSPGQACALVATGEQGGLVTVRSRAAAGPSWSVQAADPAPLSMCRILRDGESAGSVSRGVSSLAFSPDSPALLSAGGSGGVLVWDLSEAVDVNSAWWSSAASDVKGEGSERPPSSRPDSAAVVDGVEYCPMTMGDQVCWDKIDGGECQECGVRVKPGADSAADGEASEWPAVKEASGNDPVELGGTVADGGDAKQDDVDSAGSAGIRERLAALQQKLSELIERNAKADDLMQLKREDFIVDVEMKDRIERKGVEDAARERVRIEREIEERKLVAFRMAEETREVFATPKLLIEDFKAAVRPVANYPITRLTDQDKARTRKLEHLARMALLEKQFVAATKLNARGGDGGPVAAGDAIWEAVGVLPEDPFTVGAPYVLGVNRKRIIGEEAEIEAKLKIVHKEPEPVIKNDDNEEEEAEAKKNKNKKAKKKRKGQTGSGEENDEEKQFEIPKVDWRSMPLGKLGEAEAKWLIQHPAACISRQQKLLQINALTARSRILASKFNRVFEKYYKEKRTAHEMILEKRRRIMDVREELRALMAKTAEDYAVVDARQEQLRQWEYELYEERYNEDVQRARILGKKIPKRKKRGESQAERTEKKKYEAELRRRQTVIDREEVELQRDIFKSSMSVDEIPDLLYQVQESEIEAKKPLSAEEKKRAAELAARRGAAGGDDAPKRALMDMMGGELKKKSIVSDDSENIPREPWMATTPPRNLSAEQKRKLQNVEKLEQAARDERLAQRRDTLDTLRKLNAEILGIVDKFRGKLERLAECRMLTDKVLERRRYLCLSLLADTSSEELVALTGKLLAERLAEIKDRDAARAQELEEANSKLGDMKEVADAMAAADAKEYRIFCKEFEKHEYFEKARAVYRRRGRRQGRRGSSPATPPSATAPSAPDYDMVEERFRRATSVDEWIGAVARVQPPRGAVTATVNGVTFAAETFGEFAPRRNDVPEMPPEFFERFVKAKLRKIFAERKLALAKNILETQRALVSRIEAEGAADIENARVIKQYFDDCRREALNEGVDNHLTVKVPQGFVEAMDTSPLAGLSSWEMFERGVIARFNKAIRGEGKLNIGTLKDITSQYRSLRELIWTDQKLLLKYDECQHNTREVQLLRVTKNLHQVIKAGGSGKKIAEERALLLRKIDWNRTLFKKKMGEKKKAWRKLGRQITKVHKENGELEDKMSELYRSVTRLRQIKSGGRAQQGIKTNESAKGEIHERKIELLMATKRYRNIAEIQRQDIRVLHEERNRLQRKSFPMFGVAFENRSANPDQATRPRRRRGNSGQDDLKLPSVYGRK